ncbi:MAG TPA: transporter [Burkholderiaceae bacterium]|nr:transporter [Burkholderiaceae bacterium]
MIRFRDKSIARRGAAALLALAAGGARAADAGFEPVTPYRPSVSSPAQLPAAGQLEFEFGGLQQRSDDSRRRSVPYLFKLAFDKDWGVLLGGEARVWQRDADGRAQGGGDTTLVLKRAWGLDDATALGVELGAKLPTAGSSVGSGRADYSLNTIVSRDLGPVHMDANLNALRLGAVDAGTGRVQLGASASFSTPLSAQWGLTGELSGTRRSGAPGSVQWLGALTFSPSKFLTLDVGVARATKPTPATTSLFAGAVFPLAKLW